MFSEVFRQRRRDAEEQNEPEQIEETSDDLLSAIPSFRLSLRLCASAWHLPGVFEILTLDWCILTICDVYKSISTKNWMNGFRLKPLRQGVPKPP